MWAVSSVPAVARAARRLLQPAGVEGLCWDARRAACCAFSTAAPGGAGSGKIKIIRTPFMADSITQGALAEWVKAVGEPVEQDETVANIETDKVTIPVNCPEAGVIKEHFAAVGDTVEVGSNLFSIDTSPGAAAGRGKKRAAPPASPAGEDSQAAPAGIVEGRIAQQPSGAEIEPIRPPPQSEISQQTLKDVQPEPPKRSIVLTSVLSPAEAASTSSRGASGAPRGELRDKMSRMRTRIAERMKESQGTAASLTTFNEVDMSALISLRATYKEAIAKKHDGLKFGFMSPFVRACAYLLSSDPSLAIINARIDGATNEIVYPSFVDISVAVATPKGLVTPVLRDCQALSMLQVERTIAEFGVRARENRLAIEDMVGGTFTISNGGVFGSLMGTPIINVPQSAILGMHAIKERPVVVDGAIVIRPMMYLALTYDHRLIDGREAVSFLVRLKELLEDPRRLLLDL